MNATASQVRATIPASTTTETCTRARRGSAGKPGSRGHPGERPWCRQARRTVELARRRSQVLERLVVDEVLHDRGHRRFLERLGGRHTVGRVGDGGRHLRGGPRAAEAPERKGAKRPLPCGGGCLEQERGPAGRGGRSAGTIAGGEPGGVGWGDHDDLEVHVAETLEERLDAGPGSFGAGVVLNGRVHRMTVARRVKHPGRAPRDPTCAGDRVTGHGGGSVPELTTRTAPPAPVIVEPGTLTPGRARGAAPLRREGPAKLTGAAKYADDLVFPGAWYGATIRSTDAHATFVALDLDPAFDWSQVVVVTAADIPGDNIVSSIKADQPILVPVGGEIQHHAEPLALLAAPDRATLRAARHAARVREPRSSRRPSTRWFPSTSSPPTSWLPATRTPRSPPPTSSSRASTASATRSSSTSRTTR